MLFSKITILDENLEIKENRFVGIQGDRIDYVGETKPEKDYGRIVDGKGKLLMSGFYNSHAHSPMTLLRGYGENLPLDRWLNERIFPFEDKLNERAVYGGTLLAMAESLRYGIVSTTDMYCFCEDMVRAVSESGAKDNIGRGITNFTGGPLWELAGADEMKELFEKYHGAADGRVRIDMSLHAEYTNDEQTVRAMAAYTKEIGAHMHVHVSETKKEHEECKARHGGKTPTTFLNDCGLFDTPTTAAHCVWVEEEDRIIMKEKNVTVAVNPVSNMKLASGVCDVKRLLDAGINVTIGTDSVASNNSLNFIEEMKVFALAPKMMYADPAAITPRQVLASATVNGAKAQGREDCGLLKEGYKADLILLDIDVPWMYPVHDLCHNLVYSASGSDVVMTLVDGKVLYEKGEFTTIDIEKTVDLVKEETARILSAL